MNKIKFKFLLFCYNFGVFFSILIYLIFLLLTLKIKYFIGFIKNNFIFCKIKNLDNKSKKNIWIHAASVGESLLVFPLIKELLQKYPQYNFLVTTCTKSSRDLWINKFENKVVHYYLPYDFKYISNCFIKSISPVLAIFVEADFWPNYLLALKKNQIPTLLLNGRMSIKSFKRWKKIKFFIKPILDTFNLITVDSLKSEEHLKYFVNPNKIMYFGNLKYVINNEVYFNREALVNIEQALEGKVIILALSTHSLEEVMFAEIHTEIKKIIPNLLTIIIPRHANRKKEILSDLQNFKLKVSLYSCTNIPEKNTDIFLVDAFGKTNLFFEISKVVYIGKSMFKSAQGGHNLLEPMKFGKPVVFGSYMNNFKEICAEAIKEKAAIQVNDPEELKTVLIQLLKDFGRLQTMSANAKILSNKDNKIKENSIHFIEKFLPST